MAPVWEWENAEFGSVRCFGVRQLAYGSLRGVRRDSLEGHQDLSPLIASWEKENSGAVRAWGFNLVGGSGVLRIR